MINVDLTFNSGRSGYIEVKDKNNVTLFDWFGNYNSVNKTISVPKGSTINISFEAMDTTICTLNVNGTNYQQNGSSMTKTLTINEPTTIIANTK